MSTANYQETHSEALYSRSGSRLGIKYVDWDNPEYPGEVRVKMPVAGYGRYFANLDGEAGMTPRLVLEDGLHENARIEYPVDESGPDFRKLVVTVDGESIGYIPGKEIQRIKKVGVSRIQTCKVKAGSTFKGSQYADVIFTFGLEPRPATLISDEELLGIYHELEAQREGEWHGGRTVTKLTDLAVRFGIRLDSKLSKAELGQALIEAIEDNYGLYGIDSE